MIHRYSLCCLFLSVLTNIVISALILVTSSIVAGQRPSFAGLSPIGFPATPNKTTTTPDPLADRFGETEVLPIEANGDRDLIDRLSKLPVDKQPFWFINWQAYDKHRKEPQTFPQRPSSFAVPIPVNSNSGQGNNAFSTSNQGNNGFSTSSQGNNAFSTSNTRFNDTEPNVILNRFAPTTVSSQPSRNLNNNANLNNGAIVYPNSNVNPISHILPTTNVYDNSNVYTSSNSNSNSNNYPNSNSNSNTFPDRNSNWSVSPLSNPNSAYVNGNVNLNNYPAGYVNPNNYPAGNVNPNNYPAGNVNTNNYPAGNVNTNNYPAGNPNSNEYQASSFNTNSNTGTVNKNGPIIHTTQKYQWTMSFKTTKVVPTNIKNYPESSPRTNYYNY